MEEYILCWGKSKFGDEGIYVYDIEEIQDEGCQRMVLVNKDVDQFEDIDKVDIRGKYYWEERLSFRAYLALCWYFGTINFKGLNQ